MESFRVHVGDRELHATWSDDAPETKQAIEAALPLSGEAAKWGDELYFSVPIDIPPENASEVVSVGAVAYWPRGNAVCLFWGETPASHDSEPRAASPVNVIGKITNVSPLQSVSGSATVTIDHDD